MSVFSKFGSSSGVNHPAHGRVGLVVQPDHQYVKFHVINKNKRIKNSKCKCWHIDPATRLSRCLEEGLICVVCKNVGEEVHQLE